MSETHEPAAKSGHLLPFRPRYHETDQSGIVHHSVYLRWFEDGRVEMMRERGLDFPKLEIEDRVGMAVHHIDIRYRLPARFDEALVIETWVGQLKRASIRFDYRLWRDDVLLADARVGVACINLDSMHAIRIPPAVSAVCAP